MNVSLLGRVLQNFPFYCLLGESILYKNKHLLNKEESFTKKQKNKVKNKNNNNKETNRVDFFIGFIFYFFQLNYYLTILNNNYNK